MTEPEEEGPQRGDRPQAPISPRAPEPPPGTPATPPQPPRMRFRWWWIAVALALLTLNYWVGSRAMDERVPPQRALQPILPRAGTRGKRRRDHVRGNDRPGNVQAAAELRGVGAKDGVRDGDSCVRGHRRALGVAREQRGGRQCRAARHRHALVADPAHRLRAHAPPRRAPRLLPAPRGQCAGRARGVRPLAGASLRAHPATG